MTDRKTLVRKVLGEIETHAGRLARRPRLRRSRGPFQIVGYRGHGTPEAVHVKGRVLAEAAVAPATTEDAIWRNLLHALRRMDSDEVPGARVLARFADQSWETVADNEGYFDFHIKPPHLPETARLWHEVALELVHPEAETPGGVHATAPVLIPTPRAEFGIISDIDDTVIRTDATNLLRMARIVLLTNAHTRLPFEGIAAFYRALHEGSNGEGANPVFYVSSSPWNFYDLLEEVFEVHEIPAGPLFLKDYDLSREVLLSSGHHTHKLAAIRTLLETHPLPFVLIGDSGQQDPEIYRQIVKDHPGRIHAVYIRDVTSEARDREVHAIAEEVCALGVPMLLVPDTIGAAEHAAAHGLIRAEALPEIRTEKAEDEAAPDALESVVT